MLSVKIVMDSDYSKVRTVAVHETVQVDEEITVKCYYAGNYRHLNLTMLFYIFYNLLSVHDKSQNVKFQFNLFDEIFYYSQAMCLVQGCS